MGVFRLSDDMDMLLRDLERVLANKAPAKGLGHDFYPYPARMSPTVSRFLIQQFSKPGDIVLDPFMGGGTTVVEALAQGRRAVGVDINAIAYLLTLARTTPLSPADLSILEEWASIQAHPPALTRAQDKWGAVPHGPSLAALAQAADDLRFPRRRQFAKAVLLKVGQWALDRRDHPPSETDMRSKFVDAIEHLNHGVSQLAEQASFHGVPRKQLTGHRLLLNRNAVGLERDSRLAHLQGAVDLVVTSPPYPAVHVLYHRWQLRSRREIATPYWVIGSQDGHGASYYTMGRRTPTGLENYFRSIQQAFESVRPLLKDTARLCLLLAFRDPVVHFPLFIQAVKRAGFGLDECPPLWRQVPNRKWYAKRQSDQSAAREVLLILCSSQRPQVELPAGPRATA